TAESQPREQAKNRSNNFTDRGREAEEEERKTPARLQLEVRSIENSKQQLLTEEHVMMEKMSTLDKELDSLQQKGAASNVAIFLHSKEAKVT
ncbi:hypothetical protein scyTo_0019951, partial [Scyliorhinus torazame]|nr:hypothetical protein [Scyliorhinus torazame]